MDKKLTTELQENCLTNGSTLKHEKGNLKTFTDVVLEKINLNMLTNKRKRDNTNFVPISLIDSKDEKTCMCFDLLFRPGVLEL